MGATVFMTTSAGDTAQEAFQSAVQEAQRACGCEGYTGTIAEKSSYIEIELPEGVESYPYAEQLIEECDERIDDKWGPAGCINRGDGTYLFFGWASE